MKRSARKALLKARFLGEARVRAGVRKNRKRGLGRRDQRYLAYQWSLRMRMIDRTQPARSRYVVEGSWRDDTPEEEAALDAVCAGIMVAFGANPSTVEEWSR